VQNCHDTNQLSQNSYEALRRTSYCYIRNVEREGSTMHVTQVQLKMIAIGLIPVFFILSIFMPKTITTAILLAIVVITAIVISYVGMSMEKRDAGEDEDLLALPPKKP
jgi:ABC-type transport system involved in cytochrome bd biosynthesis fused ATPase/permease subunit